MVCACVLPPSSPKCVACLATNAQALDAEDDDSSDDELSSDSDNEGGGGGGGGGGGAKAKKSNGMERPDLQAIRSDLPRTKSELLKGALMVTPSLCPCTAQNLKQLRALTQHVRVCVCVCFYQGLDTVVAIVMHDAQVRGTHTTTTTTTICQLCQATVQHSTAPDTSVV